MKYRLVHITENGPYDYTLRIEERISVWSRFFGLKEPKMFVVMDLTGNIQCVVFDYHKI